LNDPATGSIGNNHCPSIHLQVFQFESGHFNEAMSPVGRDAFPTANDLTATAGALDQASGLYIPTI